MHDALTDLVRRTRRPESTVQPRLSSAYEAVPPAVHDLVLEPDATPREPVAARLPVSIPELLPPPQAHRREGRVDDAAVPPRIGSTMPVAGGHAEREGRSAPADVLPSSETAPKAPAPAMPVMPPARVAAPVHAVTPAAMPRGTPADVPTPESNDRTFARAQPVPRIGPLDTLRARVEAPDAPRADTREQAAPEIRISIGRIEVRAAAAERPPARRQPSSAASPLTLDDYLAARARRGTR